MRNNDAPEPFEEEDLLNRGPFVSNLASELNAIDLTYGAVAAIEGPWGVGKSTLLNFLGLRLKELHFTVIEFNPWQFSGAEDLVTAYFHELLQELRRERRDFSKVLKILPRYLEALELLKYEPNTIVFGVIANWIRLALEKLQQQPSLMKTKRDLEKALLATDRRLVVFIDDLDRLDSAEIREMLRLVRLVGSLPNILYVLTYDQKRVLEALNGDGYLGAEYLDKIVYVRWRVPGVDIGVRRKLISDELDSLLQRQKADFPAGYGDRLMHIVENLLIHLLTNIRKIKRYFATVRLSLEQHAEVIDFGDLLCMEALRLYESDAFEEIVDNASLFAWTRYQVSFFGNEKRSGEVATAVKNLLDRHPDPHIGWVMREVFPQAWKCVESSFTAPSLEEMLNTNRIGHLAVFLRYLDRFESTELISRNKVRSILAGSWGEEDIPRQVLDGTADEVLDTASLLRQNLHSIPPPLFKVLSCSLLDALGRKDQPAGELGRIQLQWEVKGLVADILDLVPDSDRPHFEEEIYKELVNFEAKLIFVYTLESLTDEAAQDDESRPPHALRNQLLRDFSSLDVEGMRNVNRLYETAITLRDELEEAGLAMPDFLSDPEVAWNLLLSSIEFRESSSRNRPKIAAIRNLVGGDDKLRAFIECLGNNLNSSIADPAALEFAKIDSRNLLDQSDEK